MKKVQAIDVFDAANPTHVAIPDEFGDTFNHIADKYVNAISLTSSFDTTRPCAVCNKPGHTFDDCPVLQNVNFLHKHYIQFKLFLKKQTAATINQLQAVEEDAYNDTDHPFNEDLNTGDLHQGQE